MVIRNPNKADEVQILACTIIINHALLFLKKTFKAFSNDLPHKFGLNNGGSDETDFVQPA